VVTGSRAEFGLLKPVMRAIDEEPALTLRTIVTGTHLSAGTKDDITRAGFPIDAEAPMQAPSETGRAADVAALGRGIATIGEALSRLTPDVVLVLGDRLEAFAGASAGSVAGVLVGHMHGGDRAVGIADEALRHAISKLAHLHFPATSASRRRLLGMGESVERIFQVGSPAIDGLGRIEPAADAPEVVVLQHPIGAEPAQERDWMVETLAATEGRNRLIGWPNPDPGREGIVQAIGQLGRNERVARHFPRERFLSLLKGARAIVGNSSAGLIEAAGLKVPAVNIGPRQGGRERPPSVVDCDYGRENVAQALQQALAMNTWSLSHPYGCGDAGRRLARHLANLKLDQIPLTKQNRY
jgi:UDP-hydrolysing UDP-N-acetyl-D-glucosamine 2-epimerase